VAALVGVDPVSANAECGEGVSLGGEILLFCGHAGVSAACLPCLTRAKR